MAATCSGNTKWAVLCFFTSQTSVSPSLYQLVSFVRAMRKTEVYGLCNEGARVSAISEKHELRCKNVTKKLCINTYGRKDI